MYNLHGWEHVEFTGMGNLLVKLTGIENLNVGFTGMVNLHVGFTRGKFTFRIYMDGEFVCMKMGNLHEGFIG